MPFHHQHHILFGLDIILGFLPTVIAQALIPTLGTILHQSTTLIPHLSAMKLKGIVTRKSKTSAIISRDTVVLSTVTRTAHHKCSFHDTLHPS
jgi:hypothetical protein